MSVKALKKSLGKKKVLTNDISLIAFGADACCYKKKPQAVVLPESEKEVSQILEKLNKDGVAVTFRGAGTSLSGQAISDSILMKIQGEYWEQTETIENGKKVKVRVAKTGGRLNIQLKKLGVKFGPDPASVNSATIGGIISNNASGMSCGVHANSYATIESAKIIFADGRMLDTADGESRNMFLKEKSPLVETILKLKRRIEVEPQLVQKIKKKYSIKNTTGYSLNSLIDFEDPIDIILHLLAGSEGTLGFISEAVFQTVELNEYRASAMVYFKTLEEACKAVPGLKAANATAIELLDREALRSVEGKSGIPDFIKDFDSGVTALLIDLESNSEDALNTLTEKVNTVLNEYKLQREARFTKDQSEINAYWKIRKGVFPSVGGMRKPGTVVIIEDIAVAEEHIAAAVSDLRSLLDNEGYADAAIYGHAIDGNLHFIFAQDFSDPVELEKYNNLINKLVALIVDKYDGSLKAEHGTGINMAPFVEYEWGTELYQVMKEIKVAFDPNNILNPGVIINEDKEVHLKNFKSFKPVDEIVDKCIECGFCEINCLSSGFTLSARQRIVVQRELQNLVEDKEKSQIVKSINKDFKYLGDTTCASDGLCSITCPLEIDTGKFIKKTRNTKNAENQKAQNRALLLADSFKTIHKSMRLGLGIVNTVHSLIGSKLMLGISKGIHIVSFKKVPLWNKFMPKAAKLKDVEQTASRTSDKIVVYFTSCINQSMGTAKGAKYKEPVNLVTKRLLERAGFEVIHPNNMSSLCCGMPWESKGFFDVADGKLKELEKELLFVSKNGELPVLCDNSPCLYRMKQKMDKRIKLYEPIEFTHDFLLDELIFQPTDKQLAFHVTCSSIKMDLVEKFKAIADRCTTNPVFPNEVGCCGFAGDKGFSLPELNDYALRKLKAEVNGCESGYSNSRTCEIGLSKNSGFHYNSIVYLVDEITENDNS